MNQFSFIYKTGRQYSNRNSKTGWQGWSGLIWLRIGTWWLDLVIHDDELLGQLNCGEYLDQLRKYWLLNSTLFYRVLFILFIIILVCYYIYYCLYVYYCLYIHVYLVSIKFVRHT
jgi:hypothetical protein